MARFVPFELDKDTHQAIVREKQSRQGREVQRSNLLSPRIRIGRTTIGTFVAERDCRVAALLTMMEIFDCLHRNDETFDRSWPFSAVVKFQYRIPLQAGFRSEAEVE